MNYSSTWRYAEDAWRWILGTIESSGDKVITEDGKLTKEVRNLMVTILEPGEGWPVKNSGWDINALDQYANQLLDPVNPGFAYSYGNRIRSYSCIFDDPDTKLSIMEWDQLGIIIGKLKKNLNTRRCIAITWQPDRDIVADHAPCLQTLDFLYRDGKLHLTAFFRSWDAKRAALPNIYGLNKLNEYVSKEVGVESGSLTIVAASAHIYEE